MGRKQLANLLSRQMTRIVLFTQLKYQRCLVTVPKSTIGLVKMFRSGYTEVVSSRSTE